MHNIFNRRDTEAAKSQALVSGKKKIYLDTIYTTRYVTVHW